MSCITPSVRSGMLIAVWALPSLVSAGSEGLSFEEVERKVLSHRHRLNTGVFKIRSVVEFLLHEQAKQKEVEVEITVDGENCRADYFHKPTDSRPEYRESISCGDDAWRFYTTQIDRDGGKLISKIASLKSRQMEARQIPDPRLIGMVVDTFANLAGRHLNAVVGNRKGVLKSEMRQRHVEGIECIELQYHYESGGVVATWVAPARDFSILKIVSEGDGVTEKLTNTLSEVENFGWFPSTIRYERSVNTILTKTESIEIDLQKANQPVDAAVFGFKAMGVPDGTRIYDFRPKARSRVLVCEDGELSPYRISTSEIAAALKYGDDVDTQPLGISRRKILLFVNGVVAAALGGFLIWRRRSSTKRI